MHKWILWCAMLIAWCADLNAQQTVKGTVLDGSSNNEPMIGAVIQVPGTQVGTVADLDGNFTITMPEGKNLIQVSMFGFKTQVINVKGKTSVEVILVTDVKEMDEVVVVGYGSMRKRDLSGSVAQIKGDELMAGGATDVAHGLQGKIAGVQVSQSDGSPGAGVSIIDDAFNANPVGAQAALRVLSGFPGRRIIITPGMVELGGEEDAFNAAFGEQMASSVDVAILVGKRHVQPIAEGLRRAGFPEEQIHIVSSLDESTKVLHGMMQPGDVVLYENDLPDNYSE